MNIQPESVARAMKEALHPPLHNARVEAFTLEVIHDGNMNVVRIGAVANTSEGDILAFFDAVVDMLQSVRGMATHNRSRDIAKVSGLL